MSSHSLKNLSSIHPTSEHYAGAALMCCLLSMAAACKLNIHVNEADKNKPLRISHFPQILGSESTRVSHTITVLAFLLFPLIPVISCFIKVQSF